jgi:uncharacterized membrane protein SpoIIM required for sporulation
MTTIKPQQRWTELQGLLDRAERRGLKSLSIDEAEQLCRLYRQVSVDLSRARSDNAHPEVVRFLNQLAARAHGQVYRGSRLDLRPVLTFFVSGFPRLIRQHAGAVWLTTALFYGIALASAIAVVNDPVVAYSLFDERIVEYENVRLEKQKGEYKGNFTFDVKSSATVAVGIIANNILVCMRTFAFGTLLCLPCLYVLVVNGRMLGTLEGLMIVHGYFLDFNALILTHGVLELTAICISGASGLLLGWAVIAPGPLTRQDALKRIAGDAFCLLAGAMGMLVIAGIIEAYVTPHFPQSVRWSVAVSTGVLMVLYFVLVGRERAQAAT